MVKQNTEEVVSIATVARNSYGGEGSHKVVEIQKKKKSNVMVGWVMI